MTKRNAELDAQIIELRNTGKYSLRELAVKFNLNISTIIRICKGIKLKGGRSKKNRNDEIAKLRSSGKWNYQMLADKYGVSRARVEQICKVQKIKLDHVVSRLDQYLKDRDWLVSHRFYSTDELCRMTGATASTICRAYRENAIYRPRNIRGFCAIQERLEDLGVPNRLVRMKRRPLLEVNGEKVALLWPQKVGRKPYKVYQYHLHQIPKGVKFGIMVKPNSDELFVLPLKDFSQKTISLSIKPRRSGWSSIHQYKNRLDLLRPE